MRSRDDVEKEFDKLYLNRLAAWEARPNPKQSREDLERVMNDVYLGAIALWELERKL